jgi:glutathione S-transferase
MAEGTALRGPDAVGPVQLIGSYLSPYVRKVLVCLDLKGIGYEIDPIVPFLGDERFTALSPLRRIPVLIDADVVLSDSTVICEYLEERVPAPALLPEGAAARARARWLEEFADTRIGEVFIWRLFNQVVIRPAIWGEKTDPAVVEKVLREEIPSILDYLEGQLPENGFLFGAVSLADVAVACFFRNAAFARFAVDAARWTRTAAFVERTLALESFQKLRPFEERLMRTPPLEHRKALAELGAPLTRDSFVTRTPRRGVMTP